MIFSVVIREEGKPVRVEDIRYVRGPHEFPYYTVYLGEEVLGFVSTIGPRDGWTACPHHPPGHGENSERSTEAYRAFDRGEITRDEWWAIQEGFREEFYRWIGKNIVSRRHAVEHLLRVAGYYPWAT